MSQNLQTTTIHRSVIRHPNIAGGDRQVIISAVGLSVACMFALVNIASIVMGIVISILAFPLARMIFKSDPLLIWIFRRYICFEKYYKARSTPFCKTQK